MMQVVLCRRNLAKARGEVRGGAPDGFRKLLRGRRWARKCHPRRRLEGNALAFASGATLDLQNAEPLYLAGGVTVDGHTVKGTVNALRRAGVTVTGPGSIQIGPPQGTTIIIR